MKTNAASFANNMLSTNMTGLLWGIGIGILIYIGLRVVIWNRIPARLSHLAAALVAAPVGLFVMLTMLAPKSASPLILLVTLLALPVVVFGFFAAKDKGSAGEKSVVRALKKLKYPAIHDVYLSTPKGVTQIDHIVLAGDTIVVVETKNYAGAIYGSAEQSTWTQMLAGGKVKNTFLNPIIQNKGHVAAVRTFTGRQVGELVLFVGSATFPQHRPHGVLGLSEFDTELSKYASVPMSRETEDAWLRLSIHAKASRTKETKDAHMDTVRAAKATAEAYKRADHHH